MFKKVITFELMLVFVCLAFLNISCLPTLFDTSAKLPQNIPIQEAKVDPAFATTQMKVIAFFPFSNAIQYDEGDVYTIYSNLIDKFRTKHSRYEFVLPETVMAKISSSGLSDAFNVFLGDYTNTGVANPDFLDKIKKVLNFDAILFGRIDALGTIERTEETRSRITGKILYNTVRYNMLGIRLVCYRGKDGRNIWEGRHVLRERGAKLPDLAMTIAEIFANYFGSRPY